MKVVETWQTERQDDSAVGLTELDQSVAHVRVLTGRGVHAVHVVGSKGTSIGRPGGDCDFIVDDGRMSRKHARIERSVAGWQIQDLMSRNGGFVNGRGLGRGGRAALADGAVLRLGDTLMSFRATIPTTDGRVDSPVFPGVSPVAVAIRRRIDALACGDGHVLIFGETGTGKESIAKMIGEQRAPHPFVTLNSAELSRDLARSELFGHVRGAYTHATANRPGLVDKAGDGVLFLDEIGELSLDVQAELLRFLEDGSYRPVGSTELRHSNARVVAATHVDLDRAVQNNRFRRDLLARLRASNEPLELPPLRERREDILGWTQLFFRELGREPGTTPWTVGALECLLLYPWTENLRELHRVVGHAAEQSPTFPCGTEHLPAKLRAHRGTLRSPAGGGPIEEPTPATDPVPRSEHARSDPPRSDPPRSDPPRLEPPRSDPPRSDPPAVELPTPDPTRLEIEEALRKTAGRMRTAAQVLGIDRRKLYRLCDNFSIEYRLYRAQTYRDDEDDDRDDE